MKMPKKPPNYQDMLSHLVAKPDLLTSILTLTKGPNVDGKYLHWDKLRYYQPPEGLSHEQWWFGLKFKRSSLSKGIPLVDKELNSFKFLEVEPMGELLHGIDQGSGGMIQMPEKITNPDTRDQYYVSSLIEEAITSSQLEGAATTRKIAKEMIRSGRKPGDRSEQMILNNFHTMQEIARFKDRPLSKELILQIHQLVTEKTLNDSTAVGRFRTVDEVVVVGDMYDRILHDPPSAHQLDDRMSAMCSFANSTSPAYFVHPVIRSIILHFWLAYDHPFVDGNGRTARALFYWSMLHHKYWLFEFISISQIMRKAPAKYARAFLYTETDENDLTYFIVYHLDVIHGAIRQLHQYIKHKSEKLKEVERQMQGSLSLNHRQRALIGHALRHPHQRYTIRSHQVSHNVVYQTARMDLFGLEEDGLLRSAKAGRTYYFVPAEDLHARLAHLGQ